MTSVIITFALKLGEFFLDKIADNKALKRKMLAWVERLQADGVGTAHLQKNYETLLARLREEKNSKPN